MRRPSVVLWATLAAAALVALPTAAQFGASGSDSREACRRAASVLVSQEARWDDSRSSARGSSATLYWRAADGSFGTCSADSRGRVYAVGVERWGSSSSGIEVWPGSGPGEQVRTLRCESDRGRRSECRIPRGATAQLVDRLSDAPCVPRRSWGLARDFVWVDDGCRAVFEVRW
jgi:hypothetical protein